MTITIGKFMVIFVSIPYALLFIIAMLFICIGVIIERNSSEKDKNE